METKANYVRVGIFTIVALALAFGFVYWSIFSRQDQSNVTLLVRIEGSVTGLQQGSQVLFNGLPVGSVQSLRLDPNNPRVVIATTQVQPDIPIKESTQANIGFQGLTGNAFVELRGGDVNQENIIQEAQAQGAVPVITANPSDVTDILATARDISERANNILGQFESIVQAVGPSVRDSATNITEITRNVNQFTAGLAANSDDIDNFVANLSDLARSASTVAQALPGVISNVQAIVAAIDPADVGRTVENIAAASDNVREQSGNLGNIVEAVQTAANGVGQIGDAIERNAAGIDDFLGNLGPLSETATRVATNLDTTVTSANRILGAVDEETVTDTLNGRRIGNEDLGARRSPHGRLEARRGNLIGVDRRRRRTGGQDARKDDQTQNMPQALHALIPSRSSNGLASAAERSHLRPLFFGRSRGRFHRAARSRPPSVAVQRRVRPS